MVNEQSYRRTLRVQPSDRQVQARMDSARAALGQAAWRAFENRLIPASRQVDSPSMPIEKMKERTEEMAQYYYIKFQGLGNRAASAAELMLHPMGTDATRKKAKENMLDAIGRMDELYARIPFGSLKHDFAYDYLFISREILSSLKAETERFLASKQPANEHAERICVLVNANHNAGSAYREILRARLRKINQTEPFSVLLADRDGKYHVYDGTDKGACGPLPNP